MNSENIKETVKEEYGRIAVSSHSCCGGGSSCCSGPDPVEAISQNIGYTFQEMDSVPQGSNLGLGCGNPTALATLKEGDIVLDLGSGAGFDCFLAADKVGPSGRVIGVDMTPEMVEKAKENAAKGNVENVEFRLGEIENLPVEDNSVDVIISNCVINLSPDKEKVFSEAFRVLKPGGRLMVSDIVTKKEMPQSLKEDVGAYVGCISGALLMDQYLGIINSTGFGNVEIVSEKNFIIEGIEEIEDDGDENPSELTEQNNGFPLASISVSAVKV